MQKIRFILIVCALMTLAVSARAALITGKIDTAIAAAPIAIGAAIMLVGCFPDIWFTHGRRRTLQALVIFAAMAATSSVIGLFVAISGGLLILFVAIMVGLSALYPATLRASRRRRLYTGGHLAS